MCTSIKIKPELEKNILIFGYDIKYKYEAMLAHSFDRFFVVTKFILPATKDLKFLTLNFNKNCKYLRDTKEEQTEESKQHILDLITYCRQIRPHMLFYKQQIKSLNEMAQHILRNEVDLILPQFPTNRMDKRDIITSLIAGFIGLAYEGISSCLHYRRHKALHKAVKAMESKTNIQHNKHTHLEDAMVMYGIYNAETLEKLIKNNTSHA